VVFIGWGARCRALGVAARVLKPFFCGERGDCDRLVKGVLKMVFELIFPFSIIRIDDGFQFLFLIETQIIIKKIIDLEHYCLTI
jgi:hypothetical protein